VLVLDEQSAGVGAVGKEQETEILTGKEAAARAG
jgi:hypothetical protein